jgi:hypothetical protein
MGLLGLLAVAALLNAPHTTEVVHWSPLTASGALKPALKVRDVGTGSCVDTYTTVGDIAYRCGHGHFIDFPCWRQGPKATDYVLCIGDPWTTRARRLRAPGLLLYPGVTYLDDPYAPWALELADGIGVGSSRAPMTRSTGVHASTSSITTATRGTSSCSAASGAGASGGSAQHTTSACVAATSCSAGARSGERSSAACRRRWSASAGWQRRRSLRPDASSTVTILAPTST